MMDLKGDDRVTLKQLKVLLRSKKMKNDVVVMDNKKWLLCRTVGPARLVGDAIVTSITDPEGSDRTDVILRNYSSIVFEEAGGSLDDVLPAGSYLVIHNPDPVLIVCESPSQIVLLSERDVRSIMGQDFAWTRLKTSQDNPSSFWNKNTSPYYDKLRLYANRAFVYFRFSDAIRFYDLALQYASTDGEKSIILSNKAAALCRLRCFHAASTFAEEAVELDHKNYKAVCRWAVALVEMEEGDRAVKALEENMNNLSDSLTKEEERDLKALLEKANDHARRKNWPLEHAKYIPLVRAGSTTHVYDILVDDIVEYVGPVEVKECDEADGCKGRGLFATEDINPGQTILVSKAIACHRFKEFTVANPSILFSGVVNQIHLDSKIGPLVYQLTAGEGVEGGRAYLAQDDPQSAFVDVGRLQKVLANNAVTDYCSSGLWFLPSFINHSCSERNCSIEMYNEVMIVKAVEKIQRGSEILRAYVPAYQPCEKKKTDLQAYGITCTCKLCKYDESMWNSSVGIRRRKVAHFLQNKAPISLQDPSFDPKSIDQVLSDVDFLEELWEEVPLPGLVNTSGLMKIIGYCDNMAWIWGLKDRYKDALRVAQFGLPTAEHGWEAIMMHVNIANAFFNLGRRLEAIRMLKLLKEEVILWYGCVYGLRAYPLENAIDSWETQGVDFFSL